jgi:glycosyltransferase involved in cell wall biosynthesis
MYAIAPRFTEKAATPPAYLTGLAQELFQISRRGYARNALRGFFSSFPMQARLYESSELGQALERHVRRGDIDLIFVHLVRMAEYARSFRGIPRILDMTDSLHLHYSRMPRFGLHPQGLAARIELGRLARYEREVSSWFDQVILASPVDIAWLREEGSESDFLLIPTGIDTTAFPFHQGSFDPHRIIFVGKLDYLPNADAAVYFAEEVLPLIRREVPEAEFVVAGWNPPRAVRNLAREPHVRVLANVPDVRPEITRAAVSVAPMRFGAGIQVKILESLALGTPAVATESAAGAFGEEGREALRVGRDTSEFAGHVVSILRDHAYREQLGKAGRRLTEERYPWELVLAPLDNVLERLAGTKLALCGKSGEK